MTELEFNKNDDSYRLLISKLKRKIAELSNGGGEKKIEKELIPRSLV